MTKGFRLAFVSAYPPSTGPLSEYAWHLVHCLAQHERVEHVHVLADRAPAASPYVDGKLSVVPCWSYGGVDLPLAAIKAARRLRVDAIWFNVHMTSTGNTRLSRFAGLAAPALARAAGLVTLVTLHNMLGLTDVKRTRLKATIVDLWGARVGTKLLCAANQVCVLRPEYADMLRSAYGARRIRYVPLGTPGTPLMALPAAPRRGIVAFGHFGSNKRLEPVIEATLQLAKARRDVHLYVGGTSSRHSPGYLEDLERRFACTGCVTFLGYVPEDDVPSLFERAAISVLPYATITGMSSVAVQSAMYGAPILASDIPGFRALAHEGLRIRFFEWPNTKSLVEAIGQILDSAETVRRHDALQNLGYCQRQRMETVVESYLEVLDSVIEARTGVWPHREAERTS